MADSVLRQRVHPVENEINELFPQSIKGPFNPETVGCIEYRGKEQQTLYIMNPVEEVPVQVPTADVHNLTEIVQYRTIPEEQKQYT